MFKSLVLGSLAGFVVWSLWVVSDAFMPHYVLGIQNYGLIRGAICVGIGIVVFLGYFFFSSPTPRKSAPTRRR